MKKIALPILIALLCAVSGFAASIQTLSIDSEKMAKKVPATLILPDAYSQQSEQRFPVLYLLHGAGGSHASWRSPVVLKLADQYGFMIVCPDGGVTSWYLDSPIDPTFQYETFVAQECVAYVDAHFRTHADRNSRATCGFSMGGHGALYLAIRHPQTFGTACSISGGVDIRPFPTNWDLPTRLGDRTTHAENWETHTVINQANALKDGTLAISFECGTEDFFLQVNRALHQQFFEQKITHTYAEHPGSHTGKYALAALQRQSAFIAAQFAKAETKE